MVAIIPAESANRTVSEKNISFRWTYVILPAGILLIAIILAAVFYSKLPTETAYRFSGGTPVNWINRSGFLAWAIGLQLVFALLSLAITLFITHGAKRMELTETALHRRLFAIIGNVMALPQIIVAYAMLDIFLYNIYGNTLPPLWAFALIVMFAGGVILAVLFVSAFAQSRRLKSEIISGSETDAR